MFLLLVCFLSSVFADVPLLEVEKSVSAGPSNGLYTVKVGYRVVGHVAPGRVRGIKIIDSLPNTLDLVSGNLVLLAEEPTTSEWYYNIYQVKAREVEFTLQHRTLDVELPPAEIQFSTSGNNVNHTLHTTPLTLTLHLVIPQGELNLWPVVGFFTLVFPLLAAVYAIPHYRNRDVKRIKQKMKQKKADRKRS